jgi:hypothetical protein
LVQGKSAGNLGVLVPQPPKRIAIPADFAFNQHTGKHSAGCWHWPSPAW